MEYTINLSLIKDMTLAEIKRIDFEVRSKGGSKNTEIDQNIAIEAMYACKELRKYNFTKEGISITLDRFYKLRVLVGQEFIHLHRLNYMTYRNICDTHDWLEDKGLLTSNAKRYWKKVEQTFENYQKAHYAQLDQSAWGTIQDHVRLAYNTIQPLIEPLEFAVRDYLIQKRNPMVAAGQKDDITLLTKVQTGILFCAALRNTFNRYFDGCRKKHGCDFSVDFKYADISPIGRNFVWMMEQLGVKFVKDADGDYILKGVVMEDSLRVEQAWNAIVDVVTDEDLMDKTALEAINMNPETKADYERIIEKDKEREVKEAIGDLSSKFKVTKL